MAHINIKDVSFGPLAAERDTGLRDYFVESDSYKRLLSGDKSVVLGTRGSGKTAIFQMIAESERDAGRTVIELSPEDYSYEFISHALAREGEGSWAKQGAFGAAWKYLIYVLAMKEVSKRKPRLKTGPANRIYKYLRDHHGNFEKNPIGALISYMKRLEGIKVGKYEGAVKAQELHKLYKLEEIANLLDDLNDVCSRAHVTILVDELDRGWDASEDAVAFVAGLFQAAVSIQNRTPNIRVLISLRRELYDNIPALYEDAQKVRDLIEVVEWDEPKLLDLINRRIAASGETVNARISLDDFWPRVFADTIDYRGAKSFNYIIDRTLYRPRELIQFCTDIKEKAPNESDQPINYNVISEAEVVYSEARLKDIAAEYRFQYPGLVSVFETFRGSTFNLDRDDLELHLLMVATDEIPVDEMAQEWCADAGIDHLIDVLWRIGFLRARAVGGVRARRRSGSSYLGSHQVSRLNLQTLNQFHIHPMFRAYLGTREKKG